MKKYLIFFTTLYLLLPMQAQNKAVMQQYQSQIQQLIENVYNAPTDNQRYHSNEAVVQLFEQALAEENSFKWKWDFGSRISVLTAPDKRFKIFTWPVVRDNGEYECFGLVQSYDQEEEAYVVYVLNDKSDEIVNREESVLPPDRWFGAVYQELIQTSHDGKNCYTLLGWTGVDNLTQRKVIEPIVFRSTSSKPQFGQALFRRERNIRRVVLEYTKTAMVNLRYEEQYLRDVETKRVKTKGSKRPTIVTENHDQKVRMIIFDQLAPQVPGMEGLFQYYVPTGTELAYVLRDGKWDLRENAQGRVNDERLNKEFAPLDKQSPSYQMK